MRKLVLVTLIYLISIFSVFAQSGSITKEQVIEIQLSFNEDQSTTALLNAITNNKINDIALNRVEIGDIDHEFKYKVTVSGITDQESSGRCWMFTSYNILRPKVMEKLNISEFEFSTNYLFFWDLFEKSNLFLENIIGTSILDIYDRQVALLFDSPVGDGGVWSSFTNLVEKYGVVPKSVMPETYHSSNTSGINKFLNTKLREGGLNLRTLKQSGASEKEIETAKIETMKDIYRILVLCLGEPPTEFIWRYTDNDGIISEDKKYSPESFYDEIVAVELSEYIMLMDDPTREYYKLYEIENDRNVMEGKNWIYINIPAKELKSYALASIMANEAMYFSCDVGKQLNSEEGILSIDNYDYESLFGLEFGMDKKERILSRESGSSHGMALVGVDTDKDENITKWLLENSWGVSSGHKGYLTMTDEWFNEYMFRIVIRKEFIDNEILKILKTEPIILPAWDPMFLMD
jgi:bleomycin hydrolase